jgi:hypothetical protein
MTSHFPNFISHLSSAFLGVILLMVFVTQLSSVLHAGSRVICHCFHNLRLCFSRLSGQGRTLLKSESVIWFVDNLYAEAIEAVKSRTALSASSPDLIWILGEINSQARL